MQTRMMSLVESLTNVAVGLIISLLSQIVIFGAYGIHLTFGDNVMITVWFTVISVLRSYALRRFFTNMRRTKNENKREFVQRRLP